MRDHHEVDGPGQQQAGSISSAVQWHADATYYINDAAHTLREIHSGAFIDDRVAQPIERPTKALIPASPRCARRHIVTPIITIGAVVSLIGMATAMQPLATSQNGSLIVRAALEMAATTQSTREPTPGPAMSEPDLGKTIYAPHFAGATPSERACLARGIYYEARGEPYDGQIAVAQVIINRARSKRWPNTICGVINQGVERGEKCQFSFTCHPSSVAPHGELWDEANALATEVLAGRAWLRELANVTHYHTTAVQPVWRLGLTELVTLGSHVFYSEPDGLVASSQSYASALAAPERAAALPNQSVSKPDHANKQERAKVPIATARPIGPAASSKSVEDWAARVFHP
jgi:spore germination cell wall hydrolase CwlJ-like protein